MECIVLNTVLLFIIVYTLIPVQSATVDQNQCNVLRKDLNDDVCFPKTLDSDTTPCKEFENKHMDDRVMINTENQIPGIIKVEDNKDREGSIRGDYRDTYYCRKQEDENNRYTDAKHGTKFFLDKQQKRDIFITTRRELWECSKSTGEKFNRVVTEHLSKKAIESIEYSEGTIVMKIPIPRVTTADKQLFTTAVREIKYLDQRTGTKVGIRGYVTFKATQSGKKYTEDFTEVEFQNGYQIGLDKAKITNSPTVQDKIIFKQKKLTGEGVDDSLRETTSAATCRDVTDQASIDKISESFWKGSRGTYGMIGEEIELIGKVFLDKFIVTIFSFLSCTVEGKQFYVTAMQYLGKDVIHDAYFNQGRLKVFKFKLPHQDGMSVAVEELIFFEIKDNYPLFFSFRGQMEMPEEESGKAGGKKKRNLISKFLGWLCK